MNAEEDDMFGMENNDGDVFDAEGVLGENIQNEDFPDDGLNVNVVDGGSGEANGGEEAGVGDTDEDDVGDRDGDGHDDRDTAEEDEAEVDMADEADVNMAGEDEAEVDMMTKEKTLTC